MSKKFTMLLNLTLVSTLGLSVACSKSTSNASKTSSTVSTKVASSLLDEGKTEEASEVYARVGEILLSTPAGAFHAEEMLQKALEINPNNDKANLLSAVIAPPLTAKGLFTRFKKIVVTQTQESEKIDKLEKNINASNVKEFIDFAFVMPEGKDSAKKVDDIRSFFRNEYAKELSNSLSKLDKIKSKKFSVNIPTTSYKNSSKSQSVTCEQNSDGYSCERAVLNESSKFNIDEYDVKALKILLKTQKNALTVAFSVGLNGLQEANEMLPKDRKSTDQEIIAAIRTQPNLLKIDGSKEDLKEIFDHSEDVLNDLIDFSKISSEVCSSKEREGSIVTEICVSEAAAEKINDILMFVVGPKSMILGKDQNGNEVSVEVNLRALLDSEVSSLQELLPTKFNAQGRATDLKDPTLSGVFPNGDLISKYKMVVK